MIQTKTQKCKRTCVSQDFYGVGAQQPTRLRIIVVVIGVVDNPCSHKVVSMVWLTTHELF